MWCSCLYPANASAKDAKGKTLRTLLASFVSDFQTGGGRGLHSYAPVSFQPGIDSAAPPMANLRCRMRVFTTFLFVVLHAPLLHFVLHCLFQPSVLCLMHTGTPMGVAVSRCISWFQTQLILTMCQIRYHAHLRDHHNTRQL